MRLWKKTTRYLAVAVAGVFLATCNNALQPGLGDEVDIDPPEVSFTSHENTEIVTGSIVLGGSYSDDFPLPAPGVEISFDGGSTFTPTSLDTENKTWTYPITTTDTSAYGADGYKPIVVRATDSEGRQASSEISLRFDNTPPVVLVNLPQGMQPSDGSASQKFNQTVTFQGEAYDYSYGNIASVTLTATDTAGNPYTLPNDGKAVGTNAWYFDFDSQDFIADQGTAIFTFTARDAAGLESSVVYYYDDVFPLNDNQQVKASDIATIIGENVTVDSLTPSDVQGSERADFEVDINQDLDRPFISMSAPNPDAATLTENSFDQSFKIIGSVEDDDRVNQDSIYLQIRPGADQPVQGEPSTYPDTDPDTNAYAWFQPSAVSGSGRAARFEQPIDTIPFDEPLVDGTYTLWVYAEDNGVASTLSGPTNFFIDVGPPSLDITSPTQGGYVLDSFTLQGTATDGSGVISLEYAVDGGAFTQFWSGDQTSVTIDETISGLTDGSHTITVRALDQPEKTALEEIQIQVDTTAPTISFSQPGEGESVNGGIIIRGSVSDANPIDELILREPGATSGNEIALYTTSGSTFDSGSGAPYNWQKTINTADYGDGALALEAVTTDRAGNTSTVATLNVTVDQSSDAPTISLSNVDPAASHLDNNFSGTASIIGVVEDDDLVDASSIEIRVLDYDPVADTYDATTPVLDWTSVGETSDSTQVSWSYSLDTVGEGRYGLQVRASDLESAKVGQAEFGLSSVQSQLGTDEEPLPISVDQGPPVITLDAGSIGPNDYLGTQDFSDGVYVSGTADDGLGVDTVEVEINGGGFVETTTTDGFDTWRYDFEAADFTEGANEVVIRTSDVAGKVDTITLNPVRDTADPNVEFTFPAEGTTVNDGVSIKGITGDENGVTEVQLWDGDPGAGGTLLATLDTGGTNNFDTGSNIYNWTKSVDTNGYTDGASLTLYALATDKAGNTAPAATLTLNVDQTADDPVITLTNYTVDENGSGYNAFTGSTIEGEISDDDAVDPSSIELSFDGGAWVPATSTSGSGRVVLFSHDLSSLAEGPYSVRLRADDLSSAKTVGGLTFPAARTETGEYTFQYDTDAPVIALSDLTWGSKSITSNFQGAYFNGDLTISGTTADGTGVSSVEVRREDGGSWRAYQPATDTSGGGDWSSWEYEQSITGISDGLVSFQVRAIDLFGKSRVFDLELNLDRTAPTIGFLNPVDGDTRNGTIDLSGTTSDNTSVTKVEYSIGSSAAWSDISAAGIYNWRLSSFDTAAWDQYVLGTGTSAADLPATAELYDHYKLDDGTVTYYEWDGSAWNPVGQTDAWNVVLNIRATDAAGNVTTNSIDLVVDQTTDLPAVTLTSLDEAGTDADNLLGVNPKITGSVEDDDGLFDGSVEISFDETFDGVDDYAVTTSSGKFVNFTFELSSGGSLISGVQQGANQLWIRVRDTVYGTAGDTGQNETILGPVDFAVDLAPPEVAITTPAGGSSQNTGFSVGGTATDPTGIASFELVQTNDDSSTEELAVSTSDGYATWTAPVSVDTTGNTDDGVIRLTATATDTYGGSTTREIQVTIDTIAPDVTILTPQEGATVNGDLSITGTSSDANGVSSVYVTVDDTGATPPEFPDGWTQLTGTYSWSHTVDTTTLTGGSNTAIVRVLDPAGNQSADTTVEFSVNQESDRPTIELSTFSAGAGYTSNLLPSSGSISGTVTDDDLVDASNIEIRVLDEGGTEVSGWTGATSPPSTDGNLVSWGHALTGLTDGKYQLDVRASDTNFLVGTDPYDGTNYNWNSIFNDRGSYIQFSVDTANPTSTFTSPAQDEFVNSDVTMAGTAEDANGVKRVQLIIESETPITLLDDTDGTYATSFDWSHTYAVGASENGTVNYQLEVTDAFDKVQTYDRFFTVDTAPPTINYSLPGAGETVNGSVLARGTASDNYQMDSLYIHVGTTVPARPADPASDPDWTALSGTTSWEYRFKSTDYSDGALSIFTIGVDATGNISDPASGQRDVLVDQSTNVPAVTLDTADGSLLGAADRITGVITDDDAVDVSTIEISFDGGSNWTPVTNVPTSDTVSASFSHSLTSLAEREAAYDVLVRADDVGETFTDSSQDIAPVTGESTPISITHDKSAPTSSITQVDNGTSTSATLQGIYFNDSVAITGTASDGVLVTEVEVSLAGGAYQTATGTGAGGGTDFSTWEWSDTGLGLTGDSVTLDVRVTDFHGRTADYAYQLLVDASVPNVSFLKGTGTYHGDLEVRGQSSDNILVSKVYLAEGTGTTAPVAPADPASDAAWTELASTYSWTHLINTRDINNTDTDQAYYVSVISVDGAGNRSAQETLTFTINQASDRPVLTLTNLDPAFDTEAEATGNLLESNARVLGSAEDDDGLGSIEIQTSSDGGTTWSAWTPVTSPDPPSGLSANWYDEVSALGDGIHFARIRVRDTEFVDPTTTPFNEVQSGDVAFTIDTANPAVTFDQLEIDERYAAGTVIKSGDLTGTLINESFTVSGSATDANGIAGVEVSTDGTNFSAATYDAGTDTWSAPVEVLLDGTNDGNLTITVTAEDNLGKATTTSLPVVIDTGEPVIEPTEPIGIDSANPPNVNGDVTIRGTVSDESSVSSVEILGGSGDDALTNSGTTLNWIVQDLDTYLYANSTDATETGSGTNVWRYPLDVRAYDAAGNRASATYEIDIDPDSDKPIVYLTAPSDGSSVAGTFVVQGSATDDDAVQKVTLQVDIDDDGAYTSAYDLDGSGTIGDAPYEDESVPVDVTVTNGSWSALLNDNNEFNTANLTDAGVASPTGWIGLRVVPYDEDSGREPVNLAGDAATARVYVDSTAPIIKGGVVGTPALGDPVPLDTSPTPPSGEIVRDTVTVEAAFQDDQPLQDSRIQVSLDGGVSYDSISSLGGTVTEYAPADYDVVLYTYDISVPVDTTTEVTGGNGTLQLVLKVTDETFKQSTLGIELNADNTLPTAEWDETLPHVGTPETYTFAGNADEGGDYLLQGTADDNGVISGVNRVHVYFVKDLGGGSTVFVNPNDGSQLDTSSALVADSTGTEQTIPFTEDAGYLINIDDREEDGQFDGQSAGDGDGFQESLKSQGTYDDWFVYFDTTVFPDGPIDIYYVVYDNAGNKSYGTVPGQIANNPPSVDSVEITTGGELYTDLFKRAGSLYLQVNASDAEGIDETSYVAEITEKVVAPNGAETTDGPAEGTTFDIADTTDGSAANDITIDISEGGPNGFVSGVRYTFTLEVRDTDGNIATQDVDVWVNNLDSTAPEITIDPFTQDNVGGAGGHIEEAGNSPDADSQADLSGSIRITGTAWDDTGVDGIQLSLDGGTTWVTVPAGNVTTVSSDVIAGTDYTWYYDWDTSTVAGGAQLDLLVQAEASDAASNTGTDSVTVDVVPYITGISGAGFDSGLLTHVRRSAQGNYPVAVGDTITVTGYNLSAAGTPVSVGGTALAATGSSTSLDVALGTTDTSGEVTVTTNGVTSRNNTNDNLLSQNQEPSVHNANLTDDRAIAFWDVGSVAGTTNAADATMRPDGTGGGFDWMYTKNGTELYMRYGATPTEKLLTKATGLAGGDFLYNEDGRLMFLFNHNAQWSFYNNTYAFTGSVQYGLIPDVANYSFAIDQDEAYNWNFSAGFPKLGLGNVNFYHFTTGNDPGVLPAELQYPYSAYDLNRYEGLTIRTVGDGNAASDASNRVYAAYFDTGAEESRSIVFYGFQIGTDADAVSSSAAVYQSDGTVADVAMTSGTGPADWYANIDKYFETTDSNEVALAGTQKNNANGIATPRGRQEVTTANGGDDSSDFDLGVHEVNSNTHHGFIAYFDESADGRNLKITANESLYNADPTGTLGTWTTPFEVDAAGGSDVAMAVQADGTIHLAYQSGSGYLKYANVSYDAVSDSFTVNNSVFVDALFGAGTANAVTLRDFGGGDIRPVITTFSSAYTGTTGAVRMSYPLSAPATVGAGALESTGAFTGAWETVALPAVSSPEARALHLFTTAAGEPHVGYDAATLEEATFLGF